MKTTNATVTVIACIHFLVSLGLVAFVEITGILPWEVLAVMLYPISWLPAPDRVWDHWFTLSPLLALNSATCAVCIGLPIYAIEPRAHRNVR